MKLILFILFQSILLSQSQNDLEPDVFKSFEKEINTKHRVLLNDIMSRPPLGEDSLKPITNWSIDCKGVVNGFTIDQPEPDLELVRAGLGIPRILWDESENFQDIKYDESTFVPGTPSCSWSVEVADVSSYAKAVVICSDRAGNATIDTIEYFPKDITINMFDDSTNSIVEGKLLEVKRGELKEIEFEISMGPNDTIIIKDIYLNNNENFKIVDKDSVLNLTILPNQSKLIKISFLSDESGIFQNKLNIEFDCFKTKEFELEAYVESSGIEIEVLKLDFPNIIIPGRVQEIKTHEIYIQNNCDSLQKSQTLIIDEIVNLFGNKFQLNLSGLKFPIKLKNKDFITLSAHILTNSGGYISSEFRLKTENKLICYDVIKLQTKLNFPKVLSQDYNFGKVRISTEQNDKIYKSGNKTLSVLNNSNQELEIINVIFNEVNSPTQNGLESFSFKKDFETNLSMDSSIEIKNIKLTPGNSTNQFPIYFKPTKVGEYQINYFFDNNIDEPGNEIKYVINGHGIAPNLFLHENNNGIEITDIVNFGKLKIDTTVESVTKKLEITNQPNNTINGDILTIYSIDWGENSTTNIANLGNVNNEFYINEEKMFADLGQSDYPITIGIGESVEVEVAYSTKKNDTEHRSIVSIESDADKSGNSGKYNSTITLLGNANSSSVKKLKNKSNFYPNPAYNFITFNKNISGSIEIYNLLGKKVLDFDSKLNSTFDISLLQNGVYIIKYMYDGQLYSEKLSVSR